MKVNKKPSLEVNGTEIDFTPTYRRIDVTDELNRQLGTLPDLNKGTFI